MKLALLILATCFLAWTPRLYSETAGKPKDTNTPRDFPKIASKEQWQERAREIREQILVTTGLWPMPEKTPLHAVIFGRTAGEGYSVEKVYLQPLPGFYLTGNLYRPVGKGNGPFPGVLNAHGHFVTGRFTDTDVASVPARCISFARQGMVAFAYDMVGYGDTRFGDSPANPEPHRLHSSFAVAPEDQLWNVSLMGLQTWDSIRALDFLSALPDVDKSRLAVTGESGGGTQTYILGAIDDRLAAQAPVNMVSHVMQGGCLCENGPGLRVEFSNMEIAAAAAPRPQILIAATGDWTKSTPTVEGPVVASIYRLLGAEDKLRYVQFNAPHNYNKDSREAVYAWFDHWLLNAPDAMSVQEQPHTKIPYDDLRVWADGKPPAGALTEEQVVSYLKTNAANRWLSSLPKRERSLDRYRQTYLPVWRHLMQLPPSMSEGHFSISETAAAPDYVGHDLHFDVPGKAGRGCAIGVQSYAPVKQTEHPVVVVLAGEKAVSADWFARRLVSRGVVVWVVEEFSSTTAGDYFIDKFTTYNRTISQEHVRDLGILAASASVVNSASRVILCGRGRAGLWALLAAPAADAVVADCCAMNTEDDEEWLAPDLFAPGLHYMGGFEGITALAAPHPLLLENTGSHFASKHLRQAYAATGRSQQLQISEGRMSLAGLADWVESIVKH